MHQLTFLQAAQPDVRAYKFVHADRRIDDYDLFGGPFVVLLAPIRDLADLARILASCPPNAYAIAGFCEAETIAYRRTKTHNPFEPATVFERHVTVAALDYDGHTEAMPEDISVAAEIVRNRLPAPWCHLPCVAQATGSAWVKPGLRVRLWYLLPEPTNLADIREQLKNVQNLDDSTLRPHMPIYVAAPQGPGAPQKQRLTVLPATDAPSGFTPATPLPTFDLNAGDSQPGPVNAGNRNRRLTSIAGALRHKGLAPDLILAHLERFNAENCTPPLDRSELETIASSIGNYEPAALAPLPAVTKAATDKALREVEKYARAVRKGLMSARDAAAQLHPLCAKGALSAQRAADLLFSAHERSPSPVSDPGLLQALTALLSAPLKLETQQPWQSELRCGDEGAPDVHDVHNLLVVLRRHPDLKLWAEKYSALVHVTRAPWDAAAGDRELTKADAIHCSAWLGSVLPHHGYTLGTVLDALEAAAQDDLRDPWGDRLRWYASLPAPAQPILPFAAAQIFGTMDAESCTLFRWWLAAAARRGLYPGSQHDYMLVLSGPEGTNKTTCARALAFDDKHLYAALSAARLDSADQHLELQGRALAIMDEMHGMGRAHAAEVKEFITEVNRRIRSPYGRTARQFERTFSLIGTTNDPEVLISMDGNRRFWFIDVEQPCNVDWLRANRDQLWHEAVLVALSDERLYPTQEQQAILSERQEAHRGRGEDEEALREALEKRYRPVFEGHAVMVAAGTKYVPRADHLDADCRLVRLPSAALRDLIEDALGFTRKDVMVTTKLSRMMRKLGWERFKSERYRGWRHVDWAKRGQCDLTAEAAAAARKALS